MTKASTWLHYKTTLLPQRNILIIKWWFEKHDSFFSGGVMQTNKCATSLLGIRSYLISCLCVIMWIPSRTLHPYAIPEVLSFPVEDGNQAYMKWMDEAIPDDWCLILKQTTKGSAVGQGRETGSVRLFARSRMQCRLLFKSFILFGCSDVFTVNSLSGIDVRFHSFTEIVAINRGVGTQ